MELSYLEKKKRHKKHQYRQQIKNGENVINLDKQRSIGTHWIALYVNVDNVTYFDGFGVTFHAQKKLYEKKISQEIYMKYKHLVL